MFLLPHLAGPFILFYAEFSSFPCYLFFVMLYMYIHGISDATDRIRTQCDDSVVPIQRTALDGMASELHPENCKCPHLEKSQTTL